MRDRAQAPIRLGVFGFKDCFGEMLCSFVIRWITEAVVVFITITRAINFDEILITIPLAAWRPVNTGIIYVLKVNKKREIRIYAWHVSMCEFRLAPYGLYVNGV